MKQRLATAGLFGVSINFVCLTFALNFTTATNVSIFQPNIPIQTTLIGLIARKESFSWLKILGVAVAVSGRVDFYEFSSNFSTIN